MALGGGVFSAQNKVLPGTYINFVSAARASAILSDRGVAAMPFTGDWGPENQVFSLDAEEFQTHAVEYFGYDEKHPQTQMIRELFCHATKLYLYRLNSGTVKASNTYATAKYGGSRGNALSIVVQDSPAGGYDVTTLLDGAEMDAQTVETAAGMAKDELVTIIKNSSKQLNRIPSTLWGATAAKKKWLTCLSRLLNGCAMRWAQSSKLWFTAPKMRTTRGLSR